ncbi:MAG: hypothetical protein HY983_01175 [Candidatus Magasanikbacteria bacterium]|nr:hypothetical protein [Candidatus Magasanikbacteria bacterium]
MKNIFISSLLSLALLFSPLAVLAAGGGGGGSVFVETPAPVVAPAPAPAPTPTLRCDQETMKERIQCRLGLNEEEEEQELAIQYLPEECRTLMSGEQETCIDRYKALRSCWEKPVGVGRSACAAAALGIKKNLATDLKQCLKQTGVERKVCQAAVKAKGFALIKFRLYDLSERAEGLLRSGKADLTSVTNLVNAMEATKQKFNQASTYAARRALILSARAEWKKFVAKFRGKISATDYLGQALTDLQTVK